MSTNDGGPAFPVTNVEAFDSGMTLRDYFAAAALSSATLDERNNPTMAGDGPSYAGAAIRAYRFADAMLAAREVKP